MQSNTNTGVSQSELDLRQKYQPIELKFANPFGHVAGLQWGNPNGAIKLFCIHGWLDNAGSFERMIPYMLEHGNNKENMHIVAIDHPGVGHSSHRPPGAEYTAWAALTELRRVTQQLKWDKLILIGHSLGAHYSFMYSCVYPTQVDAMIAIDLPFPITRKLTNWHLAIANSIEDQYRTENTFHEDPTTNMQVPVYSETDALKRLMDGHGNALDLESARVMLKRGARKESWGYTFNRDVRVRHVAPELRPDNEYTLKLLNEAFGPKLLSIRASESPYKAPQAVLEQFYELYRRKCAVFRDLCMDGTHHLHMNSPRAVATEICKFLDETSVANAISDASSSHVTTQGKCNL